MAQSIAQAEASSLSPPDLERDPHTPLPAEERSHLLDPTSGKPASVASKQGTPAHHRHILIALDLDARPEISEVVDLSAGRLRHFELCADVGLADLQKVLTVARDAAKPGDTAILLSVLPPML